MFLTDESGRLISHGGAVNSVVDGNPWAPIIYQTCNYQAVMSVILLPVYLAVLPAAVYKGCSGAVASAWTKSAECTKWIVSSRCNPTGAKGWGGCQSPPHVSVEFGPLYIWAPIFILIYSPYNYSYV